MCFERKAPLHQRIRLEKPILLVQTGFQGEGLKLSYLASLERLFFMNMKKYDERDQKESHERKQNQLPLVIRPTGGLHRMTGTKPALAACKTKKRYDGFIDVCTWLGDCPAFLSNTNLCVSVKIFCRCD